jgi:hypothetical protein
MSDAWRWVIGTAAALLLIGLIGYARGPEHHHGARLGTRATAPTTVVVIAP